MLASSVQGCQSYFPVELSQPQVAFNAGFVDADSENVCALINQA